MTERRYPSPEPIQLHDGINVVWAPNLKVEIYAEHEGSFSEAMTGEEAATQLKRFHEEIIKQGGRVIDAFEVEYSIAGDPHSLYRGQMIPIKNRVYIVEK